MTTAKVSQIFHAYMEARRLQSNHPNDSVGAEAAEVSGQIVFFFGGCDVEVEITPEVEEAIHMVS